MTTKQQIIKIENSINLQRRTLENLEQMDLADAGATKKLTTEIINKLEARKAELARRLAA